MDVPIGDCVIRSAAALNHLERVWIELLVRRSYGEGVFDQLDYEKLLELQSEATQTTKLLCHDLSACLSCITTSHAGLWTRHGVDEWKRATLKLVSDLKFLNVDRGEADLPAEMASKQFSDLKPLLFRLGSMLVPAPEFRSDRGEIRARKIGGFVAGVITGAIGSLLAAWIVTRLLGWPAFP